MLSKRAMNIRTNERGPITLTDIACVLLAVYYTWYSLPFMRITFKSSLYKTMFFGCFAIGAILLLVAQFGRYEFVISLSRGRNLLICVLPYMTIMTIFYIFDIGDASRHIRVSFTFWGTALIYALLSIDKKAQIRFGKYLAFLFCLTALTTVTGVFSDSSVARAIANASQREENVARDYTLMRKNISGVYLFQCLTILAPVTIIGIRQHKRRFLYAVGLLFIVVAIIKGSFTISLLVLAVSCGVALASNRRIPAAIILTLVVLILLLMPLDSLFKYLADAIRNHYISERLNEIASFFSGATLYGDMKKRALCYMYSIRTFAQNPLGTGAWYSYVVGRNGIGYHSEILDDMARYGIAAIAFYLAFFVAYYQMLKGQWGKINLAGVAFPICVTYFLLLLLNVGFRSADESIFMLYILLILPEIFIQPQKDCAVRLQKE